MTVGIAAMCRWMDFRVVVGASDRMITAGDIEFEPLQTKIYPLTTSIVMLIAGDTAAQSEIRSGALAQIGIRLAGNQSWMRVEEAAQFVSRATVSLHRRLAERSVLEPIGLTFDTFIARQAQFHPDVLADAMRRIESCRPNVQTIVAGVDEEGAHIYEVRRNGFWVNSDAAGFAAIGIGSRHAESQFMFAKHSAARQYPETQLLTYTAKRRAEVAPGVGTDTDMFVVIGLGGFGAFGHGEIERLRELYERTQREHAEATERADREAQGYFAEMMARIREQVTPPTEQRSPAGEIASTVDAAPADPPAPPTENPPTVEDG